MRWVKMLIALSIPFAISACVGNIDSTRATVLDKYSESSIKERLLVGSSTKRDALILLGIPDSPDNYNNSSEWVYKSERKDRRLYLFIPVNNDKAQELTLKFDGKGVLSSLDYMDKAPKGFKSLY